MRNQICLITGATSGLGKYISYELSKKNYQLILIGKSKKKINSLKKKFKNKKYIYICADFTNFNELKKVIRILKKFSKIDLLINNCGGLIKENEKLHNSKTIMLNYFSHVFIILFFYK